MAKSPKRRRRGASLEKRKARGGYIFVLPFILGLLLVYLPVIFSSLKSTFYTAQMVGNKTQDVFNGITNYQEALFGNQTFVTTLTGSITDLLVDIPSIVIFSLFIAVILNQKVLGRAVFRAIFFIPVICATGLMDTIDAAASSFNEYMGDQGEGINTGELESDSGFAMNADSIVEMFESMKIGPSLAEFVVNAVNRVSGIIDRCGVQMLILLAALQSISPSIYESCSIDGATTWETFWKITLPMISPMILVSAVYTVIDAFTSNNSSIMQFIKSQISSNAYIGTAMAWIYFAVIMLLVLVVVLVLRTYVFYQRRDS